MINRERQRALDYLASFGLDGREINKDSISPDGFRLIRQFADPEMHHPWPDGFDYNWLMACLAAADSEDLRLATKEVKSRMVR